MQLKQAEEIAGEVVARLEPHCQSILIAGSVRRRKPSVHDLDLVLVPCTESLSLDFQIASLGPFVRNGPKMRTVMYRDIAVDLYFAQPANYATLCLIRTGSAQHNQRLATLAKRKGLALKFDKGLIDDKGNLIAGDTEASIFEALGLKYREPEERS